MTAAMPDTSDFLDFPDFPAPAAPEAPIPAEAPATPEAVADFDIEFDEAEADEPPVPRSASVPTGGPAGPHAPEDAAIDSFFDDLTPSPSSVPEDEEPFTVISAEDVRGISAETLREADEPVDSGFVIEFDDEEDEPRPAPVPVTVPASVPEASPVVAEVQDAEDADWEDDLSTPAATALRVSTPSGVRAPAVTLKPEDRPAWLREVIEKNESSVSHAFLLEFNTKDYAYRRIGVRDLVAHTLNQANGYHIVAYYNLADGLHFPSWGEDLYRERLLDALGRTEKIQALADDEIMQGSLAAAASKGKRTPEDVRRDLAEDLAEFPDRPDQVLELLRPLFEKQVAYEGSEDAPSPCIFLWIDSVETILPDQPLSQMKLDERKMLMALREIAESKTADLMGNCLVMTAESSQDVQETLRYASSRVETVTLPLPDRQGRLDFILEDVVPMATDGVSLFGEDLDAEVMANLSAGLSKTQIEDIALRAIARRTCITEQLVKERKSDIIRSEYADVIEILDPTYSFDDIGRMDYVKAYLREDVIEPIRRGDFAMVPQGILLVGPAGTGKTMIAQALARESRMNCVNLDLSKILNRWVGSSERNFEKALRCIRSMEPTIVIVEEIDEAFPTRGSDSTGVSSRIFKRFLEFMGDPTKRGKVLVIATSNYPSRMDAALRRPGRFDKKIPFFVPDALSRLCIMRTLARRMGYPVQLPDPSATEKYTSEEVFQQLQERLDAANEAARQAARDGSSLAPKDQQYLDLRLVLTSTEGMTGAEIETIMQKAATAVYKRGAASGDGIRLADLKQACSVIVPSTSAIREMTDEALRECNDLEFVPPELWQRVRSAKSEQLALSGGAEGPGSILTA